MSNSLLFANRLQMVFASLMHLLLTPFLAITLLLCCYSINQARAGDLDTAFGSGGTASIENVGFIRDIVIQPDGKLIAVGTFPLQGRRSHFTLFRLNPNGTLDVNFGIGGVIREDFSLTNTDENTEVEAVSVALQSDGKIVIHARRTDLSTSEKTSIIARYHVNGARDENFGNDRLLILDVRLISRLRTLIRNDDKIVVIGDRCGPDETDDLRFELFRYQANGTPDETFGQGGKQCVVMPNEGFDSRTATIEPDTNKILVSGIDGFPQHWWARLMPDGQPDQSFGTNGLVVREITDNLLTSNSIALQTDGKILIAGSNGRDGLFMGRLDRSGNFDSTFSTNFGSEIYTFTDAPGAGKILVQPDGKIIFTVAGFGTVRLNSTGEKDLSFGQQGVIYKSSAASLIQPDGKLVIASGNSVSRFLTSNTEPKADLQLTASASQSVLEGDTINYFFRVTNNGDVAADATFVDALPTGTSLVSATPSVGSCAGTRTITCSFGNLASGQSRTLDIVVRANASGTLTNTARISSSVADNNLSNNVATAKTNASKLLLSLTPNVVYTECSGSSLGRIRLSSPAPSGGAIVSLTTSSAGVASVPVQVRIPAGSRIAEFNIPVTGVTSEKRTTITASYGGTQFKQTLIVRPGNGIQGVSYSPNPVVGGQTAIVTVNLVCRLGEEDKIIWIDSSNNVFARPVLGGYLTDYVVVFAGEQTATFGIRTVPLSTVQYPVITLTLDGISTRLNMRIKP